MEQFDGLDIIVNNAGYTWDASIQNHSDEQFEAMLAVHLIAPFRILRAAAEPIRVMAKGEEQEGRARQRVVSGKRVSVRVDLGGRRIIKTQNEDPLDNTLPHYTHHN